MRIFITGGTGLVGTKLVREMKVRGHTPVLLTRRPSAAKDLAAEVVEGDPNEAGSWQDAIDSCDAVINLAGEGIMNRRWNDEFKKLLRDSRINTTRNVVAALAKNPKRADGSPKVLVNASAIGIYGPHGDEELDERTLAANDFLGGLCAEWEQQASAAVSAGVRTVMGRIGIVLDKEGGALKKLLLPFKLGGGGPVASGKQYMSWIHWSDVVGLLLFAVETACAQGPMNITAPNPKTNKEFGKALGRALGRPAFLWTPGFALRVMLGERALLVTQGQRVLPKAAQGWGYQFQFPELDAALADLLK